MKGERVLSDADVKAVAAEVVNQLVPMLGMKPAAVATSLDDLDPARCDYERAQLLHAERTMDRPDYIEFHAKIMAGRLESVGNFAEAAKVLKRAASRANKLRRQAA